MRRVQQQHPLHLLHVLAPAIHYEEALDSVDHSLRMSTVGLTPIAPCGRVGQRGEACAGSVPSRSTLQEWDRQMIGNG